ncbi:MAG: FMN-binding protein [Verrucomicrobiales bacterium]
MFSNKLFAPRFHGAHLLCVFVLLWAPAGIQALDRVYEEPATFLETAFPGQSPSMESLSLSGETYEGAKALLGHPYRTSTLRYWRAGSRTAWILEEIGKTKPITVGIVIEDGEIETLKVLVYRETHGWEVHRSAFTRQFSGASLRDDRRRKLSKYINGISGATLSVNALTNLSRFALFLHRQVVGS